MPIFKIRKTTVEDFTVRAEDSEAALARAFEDYSWSRDEGKTTKIVSGMTFETEYLRPDPPCEVNDDGPCEQPGIKYHSASKSWVCEKHEKVLAGEPAMREPLI